MNKHLKVSIVILVAVILVFGACWKKFKNFKKEGNVSTGTVPVQMANLDFLKKGRPALIDLGSTHCMACKQMEPVLKNLENGYKDKLIVKFIDVNENENMAQYFKITLIPTQIFFDENGREFYRHEGVFLENEIIEKFKLNGIKL